MKRLIIAAASIVLLPLLVYASQETNGTDGINSIGLLGFNGQPLTGSGVSIGQVEFGRPGKPNYDLKSNNYSSFTSPAGVFLVDGSVEPDKNVSDHATWVAGMMISQNPVTTGVSPQALLYASAYATLNNDTTSDATQLLTEQKIAQQTGMTAINNSWG